jgi:predicted nucleotide-binding protein
MAKKAQPYIDQRPTELVQSRQEFKEALEKQIGIGEEILKGQIKTTDEFGNARQVYSDWNSYNSEFLKQVFNKEYNEYKKDYDDAGTFAWGAIIAGGRQETPSEQLEKFRNRVSAKVDNLKKLKAKADLLKSSIPDVPLAKSSSQIILDDDKSQVFIVHGHDVEAKIKTARFIEKIGLTPIILHEQASLGKTIIEKIEEYSNVGFGIVLYTPCDIGAQNTADPVYRARARQNVVFEHGYLIGKIGRRNVCALVKGDIETPNDISGVVYIKMDDADAWHISLAREMKKSGYTIDMNKVI